MYDDDGVLVTPFLRTAFNYDMDAVSRETGLVSDVETRTQQQFAEEVDINVIVERFGLTGEVPQGVRVPLNEEFVETMTYHEAMNKLIDADDAFMQFPAKIRAEFQNDAGKFVAYVSDPVNVERCREWGLAKPLSAAPEPFAVRVVVDPAEPTKSA